MRSQHRKFFSYPITKLRISTTSPSLPKKSEPSSSSTCPLCKQPYDPISRRPISEDSCGHTMCLQCFIFKNNQNGCIQCEQIIKEEPLSSKKATNDDFDQNQLFDDWNEESISENDHKPTDMDFMKSIYDDETEEGESEDENQIDNNQQGYQVQWLSDIKDDTNEFSNDHTYPHTKSMLEVFGNIFGLKQVKSFPRRSFFRKICF
jgi:hypothetical protein